MAPVSETALDALETDTVGEAYEGLYSDETLNIMRDLGKPAYEEEVSSLDPIDDLDQYVEFGLRLPPHIHDRLIEAAEEEIDVLEKARTSQPDTKEQQVAQEREDLVKGASQDELRWLKLRAYHQAMDKIKADKAKSKSADAQQATLEHYDVPIDRVPADLLSLGPEQLADRRQQSNSTSSSSSKAAGYATYSEDSQWEPDWHQRSYLDEATRVGAGALLGRFITALQPAAAATPESESEDPVAVLQASVIPGVTPGSWGYRSYTPEYQEQVALERKLKRQQFQRSAAFWISFSTAAGFLLVKTVKRLMHKRKPSSKSRAGDVSDTASIHSGTSTQPRSSLHI